MENLNKSCTIDRKCIQEYNRSCKSMCNSSSNMLLKDLIANHADVIDDQSELGANNYIDEVNSLITNKKHLKNIHTWKSRLSISVADPIEIIKQQPNMKCEGKSCYPFHITKTDVESMLLNKQSYASRYPKDLLKSRASESIPSKKINSPERNMEVDAFEINSHEKTSLQQTIYKPSSNYKKVNHQNDKENKTKSVSCFKTAKEELIASNPSLKRTLGAAARSSQKKFVSPFAKEQEDQPPKIEDNQNEFIDERLRHIDPKMIELIQSEIIDNGTAVAWDDIAGLEMAKSVIQEAVVWPLLRPDIFTGLRRPPKGILLFGPPGTGKTLIGKCVAAQCNATFFNISASSLTSKWIGDGEKMVRALFAVAKCHQPAVIFIDEIDSLLTQRNDAEHEATRRIKTEFLVQFDGAGSGDEDRILIIGATNRPQELDEAARRRLVKRLYIPLPDYNARKEIVSKLMSSERNELQAADIEEVSQLTEGFSGADMRSLCSEAAMGPIRSVPLSQITRISAQMVRAIQVEDFKAALRRVRPSVSQDDLGHYHTWNKTFGLGY